MDVLNNKTMKMTPREIVDKIVLKAKIGESVSGDPFYVEMHMGEDSKEWLTKEILNHGFKMYRMGFKAALNGEAELPETESINEILWMKPELYKEYVKKYGGT